MAANPNTFPSNESISEAMDKAFDERYDSGDFIEDIDEADMRDMLRKIWAARIARASGKTPCEALIDMLCNMSSTLDAVADRKCTAYADDNWNDHLGGK